MSTKRIILRITESDRHKLDVICRAHGDMSMSGAVKMLIRHWPSGKNNDQNGIQVVKPPP